MKPKVFREPLWPILLPMCLLIMGSSSVFIWGTALMVVCLPGGLVGVVHEGLAGKLGT